MDKILSGLLVLVGIIHLLPLSGVLGADRLTKLYGITINEPNLEILMRHRAVLFGLLGFLFIYAAFSPSIRLFAIIAGFISVLSFIVIAWSVGGYNGSLQRVVVADVVAIIALTISVIIIILFFPS